MKKTFIAVCGVFIFLVGLILAIRAFTGDDEARALDGKKTVFGSIAEGPPPCIWEAQPPERVMSESKTQAIIINTSNGASESCLTFLTLRAPGFDLSPKKEEQKIELQASSSGSIAWIVTPRKTGTYEIAVSDVVNTRIFGITVHNMFGLSAFQAKIVSILGTLFGPMMTIPWWGEKVWQWRKQKSG